MEYYKTDIKDIEKVRKNIEKAYSDFGPIDAMVYTSGITRGVLFENIEEKDWDIVFDINLKGAFFSVQAISKFMNKNGGSIVFISSVASHQQLVIQVLHIMLLKLL